MVNNNTDGLSSISVNVAFVDVSHRNKLGKGSPNKSPVSYEVLYFNTLPQPVTVVDRAGLRHVVPPNREFCHTSVFTVRIIYTFIRTGPKGSDIKNDILTNIRNMRGVVSPEITYISDAIKSADDNYQTDLLVGVDYQITEEHLRANNGSIYIPGCDKLVSFLPPVNCPAHPYAIGSVSEKEYTEGHGKYNKGWAFSFGISMVNRAVGAKPMFINLFGEPQEVPVTMGEGRDEGFYVTKLVRVAMTGEMNLVQEFFPLNRAKSLCIYSSKADAIAEGDVKSMRDLEMANIEHATLTIKTAAQRDKIQSDRDAEILRAEHAKQINAIALRMKEADMAHTTASNEAAMTLRNLELEHKTTLHNRQVEYDKIIADQAQKKWEYDRAMVVLKETHETAKRNHEIELRQLEDAEKSKARVHEALKREHELLMREHEVLQATADRLHKQEMNRLAIDSARTGNVNQWANNILKLAVILIPIIIKFKGS